MSRAMLTPILTLLAVGAAAAAPLLEGVLPSSPEVALATPPAVTPKVVVAASSDAGGVHLSAEADRAAVLANGDQQVKVRLTLNADRSDVASPRVPTDLIIVLDRSGSMSGDKLLDAQAAARELVGQLGPEDRFSLVSFASEHRVDLPLLSHTQGTLLRTIDGLSAGGGTGMVGALDGALALHQPEAGRARRTVLLSDGRPDTTAGLQGLARQAAVAESPLTTVGIGMDYDEQLMQGLADAGTGNFHWVQRGPQLAMVLGDELDTARDTVASRVRLALKSDVGARLVDAAGYPVVEGGVELGSLFSGQNRSLWLTLQIPADTDVGTLDLGAFDVSWTNPNGLMASASVDAPTVEVTRSQEVFAANIDADNWADCVVEEGYNKLRTNVSAALQRGDVASAQADIATFRERNSMLNDSVGSAVVADNLAEVDQLEAQLNEQAANPRNLQNAWAKTVQSSAYQGRRKGQSKSW